MIWFMRVQRQGAIMAQAPAARKPDLRRKGRIRPGPAKPWSLVASGQTVSLSAGLQ
jgi:hypothetical protein